MDWQISIGASPLFWFNDDLPALGASTPLDAALASGRAIGYAGFELGCRFPQTPDALRECLSRHTLRCVAGWHSGDLAQAAESPELSASILAAEIARSTPLLERLSQNGAAVVVYGECADGIQQRELPLARRPRFRSDVAWQTYAARLDAFAEHIQQHYPLRLALHPHAGTYIESPGDVDRIAALTDPDRVWLAFDTGHAYLGGATDPAVLLTRHLPRIAHLHCKDVRTEIAARAANERWSFLKGVVNGVFAPPGGGDLDFAAVLAPLKRAGYRGWIVAEAEQDPTVAPAEDAAVLGYRTLAARIAELDRRAADVEPTAV